MLDQLLKTIFPSNNAEDLTAILEAVNKGQAILIDVREKSEWQALRIKNAIHLPLSAISNNQLPPKLKKNKGAVIYAFCRSGNRSMTAAALLQKQGFSNVNGLRSGIQKLIAAGFKAAD